MNGRGRQIDFGPISLPMSAGAGSDDLIPRPLGTVEASNAVLMRNLLKGLRENLSDNAAVHQDAQPVRCDTQSAVSYVSQHSNPLALLANLIAGGSAAIKTGKESGVRIIQLTLQSDLLSDVSMTVEDEGNRWVFSLYIGNHEMSDSLALDISRLALEVGPRMDRAIAIRLFATDRPAMLLKEAQFNEATAK